MLMTKIREHIGGLIVWFFILAFVALIVVEWGADWSGSSQGRGNTIGAVNDQEISHKQFQEALRGAARQQAQQQGARGDDAQLVREVWNAIVRDVLVRQEIERLSIGVSDKELDYYTRMQPPPAVQAIEVFQTDGKFDLNKYNQFLNDPSTYQDPNNRAFVMQVENMLHSQLLSFKLQRLLMETVQVSPAEAQQYYEEKNAKVKVEYVFAPNTLVTDDEVEVGDADMQAYYDEHLDDFRHKEQVRLSYVFFPNTPTAADSQAVAKEARALYEEIEAGADFARLARTMSQDESTAPNGGDLGTFARERMVKPFADAAFALKPGQVSEPVRTVFGWHLIKVDEKLNEDGKEKVKARHILLRFTPSRRTEEENRARVEELEAKAQTKGLEAAAKEVGAQLTDSGFLGKDATVRGLGPDTAWLVRLFFDSPVGTLSRVVGNDQGYWIAALTAKRAAGVAPLSEVRALIEREVVQLKKAEKAAAKLAALRQQVTAGGDLATAASQAGLEVRAPEPFALGDYIPGVGNGTAFARTAFQLEAGQLSEPVVQPRGAYLIRVVEKMPIDAAAFEEAKEQVMQELLQQRQMEALQVWEQRLYTQANIQDNRHFFYTF